MRLGLNLGYSGSQLADITPLVREADRLAMDSIWVAESYGSDAVAILGRLSAMTEHVELGSAVLQIPGRTPAATAMAAMTLDAFTGGRFNLGLGVSGPQVVEGWHGQPFADPLGRTREYVEIIRRIVAHEQPVAHDGVHYQLPYAGPGATGAGRPLRSILRPTRPHIPIHLAALGVRNVELCAEIADGWLPFLYSPDRDVYAEVLQAGASRRSPALPPLEITTTVRLAIGGDVRACRDRIRPNLALYIGGMGPADRNFYHQAVHRMGFGTEADAIQERYLAGDKTGAAAMVPDALVDELALVGPLEQVCDRLDAWAASPVDRLLIGLDASRDAEELLPHLKHLAAHVAGLIS